VWLPFGHSPDVDLVTRIDERLVGVQVKTSTVLVNRRYQVALRTNGGNRSWSGLVKCFSPERCDWLFVLVADGRRWFIPATQVGGGSGILLGGPKYAAYEVEPGARSPRQSRPDRYTRHRPGGVPERSKGTRCKRVGTAFEGSNPSPAIAHRAHLEDEPGSPFKVTREPAREAILAPLAGQ
jgi:hypothetical protein